MHFLITGHTGFKGAWLSLILQQRGHLVSGISLEPEVGSLYEGARIGKFLENDVRCDIRESAKISSHFKDINPDVVIHLAAQALVRESYKHPVSTMETNVLGTLNVLNASQQISDLKAQLIITTDKVYKNTSKASGYVETDPLGGQDPYSASKAMADIATQSWLFSFENSPTAIARAGNVIGGGDVCLDRLMPDLIRSYASGLTPKLRAPNNIRPWQHVLDCLNGYLLLIDAMIQEDTNGAWNFGPDENSVHSVKDVVRECISNWGSNIAIELHESDVHEAGLLQLNCDKARQELQWSPRWDFKRTFQETTEWYKRASQGEHVGAITLEQITRYEETPR